MIVIYFSFLSLAFCFLWLVLTVPVIVTINLFVKNGRFLHENCLRAITALLAMIYIGSFDQSWYSPHKLNCIRTYESCFGMCLYSCTSDEKKLLVILVGLMLYANIFIRNFYLKVNLQIKICNCNAKRSHVFTSR